MTDLSAATVAVLARPAPVFVVDTCNFLDLIRREPSRGVTVGEIEAAVQLRSLLRRPSPAVHLIVPELVRGEYARNAEGVSDGFRRWVAAHDESADWLSDVSRVVGGVAPPPSPAKSLALDAACRALADDLLNAAVELDRDRPCVERAVARVVAQRRPSHKNELKDSMNLEQALELCRRLRASGFTEAVLFVSSNVTDFAISSTIRKLHPDLVPEFAAVSMEYVTSLAAAIGSLRARQQLP